jgi:hypothetical protein
MRAVSTPDCSTAPTCPSCSSSLVAASVIDCTFSKPPCSASCRCVQVSLALTPLYGTCGS